MSLVTFADVVLCCCFRVLGGYIQLNSIEDYLYSALYDTIVAKQLYRKLSIYNRFIYCRNLIYLTYGKMWLIVYTV